ncbi:MAG: prepilin-type N-terminal cleavage/methylation domain-containing protein [Wenzhouxiangellaceae bacterium]|nr:MAG: prepilin-type N-terminal cleavage/methylation domain-containing protein [Wenzhouxiangellaceae bacterium]
MPAERKTLPGSDRGFTLIEVMIVVVIIGVLAAIAYPAYQRHVIESNRSAVQAEMMEVAQLFERCFTRTNAYNNCAITGRTTDNGRYQITVAAAANTFTVTATPQSVGQQSSDVCGNLTLNHLGVRGNSGGLAVGDCW